MQEAWDNENIFKSTSADSNDKMYNKNEASAEKELE